MNKSIFFISMVLLTANLLCAQIIHIPADYPTIQQGIDAAIDGDTVLVAPGTYVENLYIVNGIVLASYYLTTLDTSYISQTVIDGSQNGSVVEISCAYYTTVYLNGFTISNGNTTTSGGGVFVSQGIGDLSNLVIKNNYAFYSGGGLFGGGSVLVVSNVKIINNEALYNGGGIGTANSSVIGYNVVFRNNIAGVKGGGFFSYNNSVKFFDSEFENNSAEYGGGIYFAWDTYCTLENVKVLNNTASQDGGGIYTRDYTFHSFINVEIGSNHAINGGGMFAYNTMMSKHRNVLMHNNIADSMGGGIYLDWVSLSTFNATIVDNSAEDGSGIYCFQSDMNLSGLILFAESTQQIVCSAVGKLNTISVSASLIMGGQYYIKTNGNATVNWLEGNINQNPQFVNSGDFPYQINDNSPCIDAGSSDTTGITEFDLAGEPRFFNNHIDMGAYEWNTFVGMEEESKQVSNNGFLVYPNPAKNKITITTNNQATINQLNIYNQLGQKVLHLENPPNTIDISEIGKGLFVVEIVSEGEVFRSNLIKN